LDNNDPAQREVIQAAQRIHNAGYRKTALDRTDNHD
jgi:hypothetical protein